MSGLQVVKELKDVNPAIISIIPTGYGSISTAVDSIKLDAYHYQTKPCNISILAMVYRELLAKTGSEAEQIADNKLYSEYIKGITVFLPPFLSKSS